MGPASAEPVPRPRHSPLKPLRFQRGMVYWHQDGPAFFCAGRHLLWPERGAFGLSSAAALMYLTQERNLKFHKLKAIFSLLPSIQRLEAIVSRLLLSGFILWTIGLAIGALDLTRLNNPHAFRGDPKIIWSA